MRKKSCPEAFSSVCTTLSYGFYFTSVHSASSTSKRMTVNDAHMMVLDDFICRLASFHILLYHFEALCRCTKALTQRFRAHFALFIC